MNQDPRHHAKPSRLDLPSEVAFAFLLICAGASLLSVAISQIALGACLLTFLFASVRGRRPTLTGLEIPALALLGWALLMILFSPDRTDSLLHARRFYLFTALWLAATLVNSDRKRWLLFGIIVLAAVVNSAYSVVTESLLPGTWNHRIALIQHSTMTGAWLMMSAALVMLAFVMSGGRWLPRVIAAIGLPVTLTAIVLTQTRSAWLGLLAGVAVVLWLTRRRYLLIMAVILALAILIAPSKFKTRVQSIFDDTHSTNNQRVLLWQTGWELIKEHPITGVGDRNLAPYSPAFYRSDKSLGPVYLKHLHQNQIMLATIWGIPGLALGMWFIIKIFWVLIKRWQHVRQRGSYPVSAWVLAAIGVWFGVQTAGLFDWTFGDQELSLFFMLCTGLGLSKT